MAASIRKASRNRTIRWRTAVLAAALLAASAAPSARGQDLLAARAGDNVVLQWDNACLEAIRRAPPGPTVVSRAIAVLHTAMFDAWSAYDAVAVPTVPRRGWRRPAAERTDANKAEAVSFAAYRAAVDLFPAAKPVYDALMAQLAYDASNASTDPATPAGVGNAAAAAVLEVRHRDGSNQLGDLHAGAYSDYTGYQAVNTPTTLTDPNRWQPLSVVNAQGQAVTQVYTTPHWGNVTPFALPSGSALRPMAPAQHPSAEYASQAADLIALSAGLTDFQKVTAEYFADGPSSEFPPGHWALFAQVVSRRDAHTLDDDVKMFFALGNAVLDAGICAWDAKRAYDSVRPVTAIHFLYAGQTIQAWVPFSGTQSIPGELWRPYQLATVVTPPFPEFFSGHSVFSAASAEVLKSFTGSDAFGYEVTIKKGTSIGEFGLVPAADLTLSFPTFSSAADAAGMSRRWGGIHFAQGDLTGRSLGRIIGAAVWTKAKTYFDGTAYPSESLSTTRPRSAPRTVAR